MIKLENIYKIYEKAGVRQEVLRELNLEIDKGDMVAVMGASGSGKTTLLNIIGGMDYPTSGEYYFNGNRINYMNKKEVNLFRKSNIAFIFQQFALMDNYSIRENIELPMEIQGVKRRKRQEICNDIMEELGIIDLKNKRSDHVSGGEKQRCAIGRAIAANTDVILADEPTGALDRENSKNIMDIFTRLNNDGKTIVIVTHDEMVASYCKKVISISDGSIIA